jgi:two-component system response regulator MprA
VAAGDPILVVDDDAGVRATFAAILEGEGYAVATAPDGRAALERLRRERFAVALLDHAMPELDGLAVLRELRAGGSHVPVVLISASMEPGDAAEAHQLGAVAVLPKPPGVDLLLRLCRELAVGASVLREGSP